MVDCGSIQIASPEPDFDPGAVFVDPGNCSVSGQNQVSEGETLSPSAVVNNNNEQSATATVAYTDSVTGTVIARDTVTVPPLSTATSTTDVPHSDLASTFGIGSTISVRASVTEASQS